MDKISIDCIGCKKDIKLKPEQLKPGDIKCPHCGKITTYGGDNIEKILKGIDDSLDDLPDKIDLDF